MYWQSWITIFIAQVRETTVWEWIAVIMGVAEVLYARKNNVLLYPAGIIGTALGIYIMANARLYGEAVLSLYYLVMSIYGWVHWLRKKNEQPLPVTYANRREWLVVAAIIVAGWGIFYIVLTKAHSSQPLWDGWVSATAWAGMWLLTRRKIENWIVLNVSNLFAIPLLVYKKLPLLGGLTLFLFIVAIFGYFEWRKIYRAEHLSLS
jgi:nicotinamide mononucleotide transporter